MKKNILTVIALLFFCIAKSSNYYINPFNGNDTADGKSEATAWRTIKRVNSTTFVAGDSILFARDGIWFTQIPLQPKGEGSIKQPIVIASYGHGLRPLIVGSGFEGKGVISLFNQSHWVISALELTNNASSPGDRRGIEIMASNYGVVRGIMIHDMIIHDIKGIIGGNRAAKRTAGIEIIVTNSKQIPTRFDKITISDCTIYNIENEGIVMNHEDMEYKTYPGDDSWKKTMFTNVTIRNNMVFSISKNAMIIRMTDNGIIENNVCFNTATIVHGGNTIFSRNVRGTIFQYNEGFLNRSREHDGSLYDPDINSPETIWQYSYSHDNAQGLAWFCTDPRDKGIVIRDNISRDDQGFLFYFNYAFTEASLYRNAFYVSKYVNPYFIRENPANSHLNYLVSDNIIINHSNNMRYFYPEPNPQHSLSHGVVRHNMFLGNTLIDGAVSEKVNISKFRKFYSGVLHSDALDTVFNNTTPLFRPQGTSEKSPVIGYINNIPVYAAELEREMKLNRWMFVNDKGIVDNNHSRKAALETLKFIKMQQQEMIKRKMPEAAVFNNFEEYRQTENSMRSNAATTNVMFFGPKHYSAEQMWHYFYVNAACQLLKKMSSDILILSEEQLKEHFMTGYNGGIEPTWEKRGFDYSKKAITSSLRQKMYTDYFQRLASEAIYATHKH